jgi:hypothetical protein
VWGCTSTAACTETRLVLLYFSMRHQTVDDNVIIAKNLEVVVAYFKVISRNGSVSAPHNAVCFLPYPTERKTSLSQSQTAEQARGFRSELCSRQRRFQIVQTATVSLADQATSTSQELKFHGENLRCNVQQTTRYTDC